jgi:chloramphenicol-sensitive protein RarD
MQFLTGVLILHEPMPPERWIGFIIVWIAVAVFVIDLLRATNATRSLAHRDQPEPPAP